MHNSQQALILRTNPSTHHAALYTPSQAKPSPSPHNTPSLHQSLCASKSTSCCQHMFALSWLGLQQQSPLGRFDEYNICLTTPFTNQSLLWQCFHHGNNARVRATIRVDMWPQGLSPSLAQIQEHEACTICPVYTHVSWPQSHLRTLLTQHQEPNFRKSYIGCVNTHHCNAAISVKPQCCTNPHTDCAIK